jgi:glycosyltransferase involved in cell wall biosynthesis
MVLNRGGVAGGHVVQATKTAEALAEAGLDVSLTEEPDPDVRTFDVVHAFAARRESLRRARQSGAAVVVSPIWVRADYRYMPVRASVGRLREIERAARLTHSIVRRGIEETGRRLRAPLTERSLLFELADLLLPNSKLEAEQIRSDLGVTTPMHVVPNAFDDRTFTPPVDGARRSGVAYVGRIEPHKNQLGLIRELAGSGIPLTIAGPTHPDHVGYDELCRKTADGSVTFLPGGSQWDLRDVYRSARVHVLPSWFETTGLVSLEAAACGCAVVTTSRGYAREYFGTRAVYCDPGIKGSIRRAVATALERGPAPSLRQLVCDRFTWSHTAAATIAGYELALRARSTPRAHYG